MMIGLGLAAALWVQLQAPAQISFSVGSVGYEVAVPEGYCLPGGADMPAVERTNAGDVHNRTVLFAQSCARQSGFGARDYTRIVTPKGLEDVQLSREQVFAQLGGPSPVDLAAVSRDVSRALGATVSLAGETRTLGHDDVCLYESVVATVTVNVGGRDVSYRQPAATCYTAIGGRAFAIIRYGLRTERQDIVALLGEARALAVSVRARQ
jgi:hypothetical protein